MQIAKLFIVLGFLVTGFTILSDALGNEKIQEYQREWHELNDEVQPRLERMEALHQLAEKERRKYPVYMPFHSDRQLEIINYAYEKYKSKDFLYLLKSENGKITHDRIHDNSANAVGTDYGLCGINNYFHPEIVSDPRFTDWKWQLDQCWDLYERGVPFHGNKESVKHFFIFND